MRENIKKYTYKLKKTLKIPEIEESIIALFREKYKKVEDESFSTDVKDISSIYGRYFLAFINNRLEIFKELLNDKKELKKQVIKYNYMDEFVIDNQEFDKALDQAIAYVKELEEKKEKLKREERNIYIRVFEKCENIIRCKGNVTVDYEAVVGYRNSFNFYDWIPSQGSYNQEVDFTINNSSNFQLLYDFFEKQKTCVNSYIDWKITENCTKEIEEDLNYHIHGDTRKNIKYGWSHKLEPLEEYEVPVYSGLIIYDNKLFYFKCYYDGLHFILQNHVELSFLNNSHIKEKMVEYETEDGKLVDNFLENLKELENNYTYYNYLSKQSILKIEGKKYSMDKNVKIELEKKVLNCIWEISENIKKNINNYNKEIRQFLRKRYIDAAVYTSFEYEEEYYKSCLKYNLSVEFLDSLDPEVCHSLYSEKMKYYKIGLGLKRHVEILDFLIDKFYIAFSLNEDNLSYEGESEYHLQRDQYSDIITTLNRLRDVLQEELVWCGSSEAQKIIKNIIEVEAFNHKLKEEEKRKAEKKEAQKKKTLYFKNKMRKVGIVSLILMVIITIFLVIGDGYKTKHFDIEIVSKSNSERVGYTYYYEFEVNIINNSPHDIEGIQGKMYIYNEKNELIDTLQTNINVNIASKSTQNVKVELYNYENKGELLWNTDLDKMRITFGYDFIRYSTFDYVKHYNVKKEILIHEINENSQDVTIKKDLLELAQYYVSKDVIIPENYESENHSERVACYSAFDDSYHNSFHIFFKISEEYSSTFFENFLEKLEENGYQLRYSYINDEYEYVKGNTVIRLSNVQESYLYNPRTGEEEFDYYYLNFYAYILE